MSETHLQLVILQKFRSAACVSGQILRASRAAKCQGCPHIGEEEGEWPTVSHIPVHICTHNSLRLCSILSRCHLLALLKGFGVLLRSPTDYSGATVSTQLRFICGYINPPAPVVLMVPVQMAALFLGHFVVHFPAASLLQRISGPMIPLDLRSEFSDL
jgi:hypothetical protein